MIIITEVAEYLQKLLNSVSQPTDFEYVVAVNGFHLDTIADTKKGKNFIPCFLGQTGGDYDPIPNLQQIALSYELTFYFPVRFRNDFYVLSNYLANNLVGKILDIGDFSGKCLTTIDPPTFGEITSIDLTQFRSWVENTYQRQIGVSENYMSMAVNIYFTTIKGYWGNDAKFFIVYKNNNGAEKEIESKWLNNALNIENTPQSQQLLGESFAKNIIGTSSKSFSLQFVIDDNCSDILAAFLTSTINNYDFKIKINVLNQTIIKDNLVLLTAQPNFTYGEPISMTLTFGDKV